MKAILCQNEVFTASDYTPCIWMSRLIALLNNTDILRPLVYLVDRLSILMALY